MIEVKMPGDHLDHKAIERAFLRRQARQVRYSTAVSTKGAAPLGRQRFRFDRRKPRRSSRS